MGKISEFFGFGKKKVNNQVVAESNPFVFGLDDYPYPWALSTNNELKLSAVYGAITTIAATMSKIPFFVQNEKTKEKLDDSNLYRLFNIAPNGIMDATTMNGLLATWVLLFGEAYVLPVREFRSTKIKERLPFHPNKVTKFIDKTNYQVYYDMTFLDGHTERKSAGDVEHYMWFTLDGINGISPLEYARNTVQAGLSQDAYNQSTYKNGCRPSDYITVETDLGYQLVDYPIGVDEKGNSIIKKMSPKDIVRYEWYKAKQNGQGTVVLDKGMKYDIVTQITPEQMQFVTSKDVTVQDIARFFRMGSCMYKLGVGKQSYSTNEQAENCYIKEAIMPMLRQWEHQATIKSLTRNLQDKGWQIRGNEKVELRGDTASQLAWLKGNKEMGVYNINEVRKILELPEIGELGDIRTIGPNAVPLEKAVSGETAGQATPNPISGDDNEQDGNEEDA